MPKPPDILSTVRDYLAKRSPALNERLPPERTLSEMLGVSRTELRKALAVLEGEGQIWRHIGRGTFIGARPVVNLDDIRFLGSITTPAQILEARLALEPEIARLAAMRGIDADFAEMKLCEKRCREARIWRVYEAWDHRFHLAIALAARNKLMTGLFETLNAVRRTLDTARPLKAPPGNYPGFAEHQAIYQAIVARNPARASDAMRDHLISVRLRQESQTSRKWAPARKKKSRQPAP
ncbi:GntR family transcriptional regulator [Terrihabitans soli]|uniref:GntR family transcriptional regulator n=1 Tax=Terrihabitans soli TaxID=708113 RepID=A0A6S6QKZ7_9HYPH|nr:FCD domain-containing protein [Terrihabitans soli]BCJ89956.1 GntR family transcriptional regulator [Terrihabitans soli]